jgi:lipocalin-like protein
MSHSTVEAATRARLLGPWSLVSWEIVGPDGTVSHPLGEHPVGQLLYDGTADRVSAQLVRAGQQRFASDDWLHASADEMCAAWPAYFGYFGRFTIDTGSATVTHHIDAGWFPNLAGVRQVRRYRFDGDDLVLTADTPWGEARLVWRRPAATLLDCAADAP